MQRISILICVFVFLTVTIYAQTAKISGHVFNEKNEPVFNASIIIEGIKGGKVTDADGHFEITAPANKKFNLLISFVGYKSKQIIDLELRDGQVYEIEIILEHSSKTSLQEVVIKGSARKESINSMIQFQKNNSAVAQVVSAEAIRKAPDRNTGEILKRVSGISLQEGKYIIVRGLADRYNQTMVNGALMSSTEPDRKTFAYDLFPASAIENIIVNKTAVPELPGEFSGGLVQLNTKDIPAQNYFSVTLGTGVNLQTTFKPFYTYKGGRFDWLGIDDGSRALPSGFPIVRSQYSKLDEQKKYDFSKNFKNNWTSQKNTGMPNLNLQFNGGWSSKATANKLGFVYALTYNQTNRTIIQERTFQDEQGQVIQHFNDDKYNRDISVGALGNLSFHFNKSNKISFKNIFNINSNNYTLLRNGENIDAGNSIRSQELAFRSNMYYSGQLSGEHLFDGAGIKLNWNGNITTLYQSTPDLRRVAYVKAITAPESDYQVTVQNGLPSLSSGLRFYSDLMDYVYGTNINASKSFNWLGQKQSIKTGYLFQHKDRIFSSRPLGVTQYGASQSLLRLPLEQIFAPENFGPDKFKMDEINNRNFDYLAKGFLHAGFLQMDNQFGEKFRAVWGLRVENFNQQLTGADNSNNTIKINTHTNDFLPSANLTYKLNSKTNLRFAASQTLIRPEFRELAPFEFFDFELVAGIKGNEKLKRTKITNLDLRYEFYPQSGELITAGLFYKHFKNPIEPFLNQTGPITFNIGYGNAPTATAFGVEVDFRKKLDGIGLKNVTAFGNLAYIYNKVKFGAGSTLEERPMQGQSPYVLNGGVEYNFNENNTTITALFNQVGRRIYFVGLNEFPSVWEAPRPLFDLQLNHKFKNGKSEMRFSATDIFNAKALFYQDNDNSGKYNESTDFRFRKFQSGTNINIAFTHRF